MPVQFGGEQLNIDGTNGLHLWHKQLSIDGVNSLHLCGKQPCICGVSRLHLWCEHLASVAGTT